MTSNFPRQMLSFKAKNKEWRKKHLMWAANKTYFNYNPVRKSIKHKMINYNLINGNLTMEDLVTTINPDNLSSVFVPEKINHYPIINSKLRVLSGEEAKRPFDFRVIITNPNAISEIEQNKKNVLMQNLQSIIEDQSASEEEFNQRIEKLNEYITYEWQDIKEIQANEILKHYIKEYNMPLMFNKGFTDAMTISEEIYQCDIVGGEPVVEKIDPMKIRVFRSGYSDRIEDADVIVLEDYWSPGRIIDYYYDVLSKKDIEYIEKLPNNLGQGNLDSMDNIDERYGFINTSMVKDEITDDTYFDAESLFQNASTTSSLLPYDLAGNIRVIRVYWKSKRKILKVKSYDPQTGEEQYDFYPENYVINENMGEEATTFWINEAWEGTLIGDTKDGIYVNMRPRPVQYNRLSNPSKCHFGIIGSIYNINGSKPFSLVDMMKQYNYTYDVIHDRLNKALASNWGAILEVDLSKIPKGWTIEKWLYYAKINHLAIIDSFKEGSAGASLGKLAGGLNNAGKGMLDTNIGNYIQQLINLLEFIKMEMSEVVGITKQREGQVSNRETVGGVERATLQSSHITEWLFTVHDDVKKRVLECFLDTARIALKGRNIKFQYILSDMSIKSMEVNGDDFAEADYGLIVDGSNSIQELQSKLDMLAQAALQNQTLSFSTIIKLYSTASLAEKQRLIEKDERAIQERQAQAQQQQLQSQERIAQMQQEQAMAQMQQEDMLNQRDNETKILIAEINSQSKLQDYQPEEYSQEAKDKLQEQIREFDEKIKLEWAKHKETKNKNEKDAQLKQKQINKQKLSNK